MERKSLPLHDAPAASGQRRKGGRGLDFEAGIRGFLERNGDEAAEAAWWAALSLLERAAINAREGRWGPWRFYPRGQLRRLRRDIAQALELARLAVALQEEDNETVRDLDVELREAAAEEGRRRRRAGTIAAEEARLAKAAARRARA